MIERLKQAFTLPILFSILILSYCNSGIARSEKHDIIKNTVYPAKELYHKILSYQNKRFISYSRLIRNLNKAQVIFLGEYHNSQVGHEYQQNILKSLYKKDKKIAIAMEMFERDVQPYLDRYLLSKTTESAFLKHSRPWVNYHKDYRPLVIFAKKHHLKIIAMNAPRWIARRVVRQGKKAIFRLEPPERTYIAQKINFKDRFYKKYFYRMIRKGHPNALKYKKMLRRFRYASALKDSTMAESITKFLKKPGYTRHKVVSINGKFHSDYGLAIPKRLKARLPRIKMVILTLIPLPKNEKVHIKKYLSHPKIADYIIFTDDQKSYS